MKCIEDEIPFELPDGWAWSRIRDIASVKGGKRLPKGMSFSSCETSHAYIRVTDMKNHSVNTDDLKYITEEVFLQIKNYTISKDDLYVTIAGTIGVTGEVPAELDGMNLTENAVKVTGIQINKAFLCLVLQSEFVQQQFQDKTHQVAMPKLALDQYFYPSKNTESSCRKRINAMLNSLDEKDLQVVEATIQALKNARETEVK